jgi:hypothetical protein
MKGGALMIKRFSLMLLVLPKLLASLVQPSTDVSISEDVCLATCTAMSMHSPGQLTWNQDILGEFPAEANVAASGEATYGTLSADALLVVVNPEAPNVGGGTLLVESSFIDVMKIDYQPFTGKIGYLQVGFTFSGGTTTPSYLTETALAVKVDVSNGADISSQPPPFVFGNDPFEPVVPGFYVFPYFFPFRYGEPFNFDLSLEAVVNVDFGNDYGESFGTANLSALNTYSPDFQPVSGFTFTSGSGTEYPIHGEVPEPSATALFLFVLTTLGLGHSKILRAGRVKH